MGYGEAQIADLAETIAATPCDVVVVGTPIDLTRVVRLSKQAVRVRYDLREVVPGRLAEELARVIPVAVGAGG
jgi:predicted GTPase